jgi:hypothetical protein
VGKWEVKEPGRDTQITTAGVDPASLSPSRVVERARCPTGSSLAAGLAIRSVLEVWAGAAEGDVSNVVPLPGEMLRGAAVVGTRNGESLSSVADAAAMSEENGVEDELELVEGLAQGPARFASLRASSLTVLRGVDEEAGGSSACRAA